MKKAFQELKECKTLEQVDAFITKTFPKGLDNELHRPKDPESMFYPSGMYIGFNLDRFIYNSKLAAYCHAIRDNIIGRTGTSYWSDFDPHVKDPDPECTKYYGQEVHEVWTGR